MRETSLIEIDLSALDRNLFQLRRLVGDACTICPVIKADAYGLGAIGIGSRLVQRGCRLLAVYSPAEAASLKRTGLDADVLVLQPVRSRTELEPLDRELVEGRIHLALHDRQQLELLDAVARRLPVPLPVHLVIDTGLHRGGCDPHQGAGILAHVAGTRQLRLAGVSTHFASADSDGQMTDDQMAAFERFLAGHGHRIPDDCLIHAANTFATLRHARFHRSMVRVGLAWAGYGPEWMTGSPPPAEGAELCPILRWTSRLIQLKRIGSGLSVGYGLTWTARRDTLIGLIPVGYADGYPMALASTNQAPGPRCVGVLNRSTSALLGFVPIIGAISMDQTALDLTDIVRQHGAGAVELGQIVELIAPDRSAPNHLPTLARAAGTIPHEFLSRLHPRIRRIRFDAGLSGLTIETKPQATILAEP